MEESSAAANFDSFSQYLRLFSILIILILLILFLETFFNWNSLFLAKLTWFKLKQLWFVLDFKPKLELAIHWDFSKIQSGAPQYLSSSFSDNFAIYQFECLSIYHHCSEIILTFWCNLSIRVFECLSALFWDNFDFLMQFVNLSASVFIIIVLR